MLHAFGSADNLLQTESASAPTNVVRPSGISISRRSNWRRAAESARLNVYCREYTETKVPVFSVNVLPLTAPV